MLARDTEDLSTTSVEDVCRRLDGIPLSIELAAARARSLGVDAVVAGLEDRFALLTGGTRRRSERHQTMRTTIDWSYRLLTPDEQRLFRWLAVHVGFELDTAAVVGTRMGASGAAVAPLLASLVDKNMVDVDHGASPRDTDCSRRCARSDSNSSAMRVRPSRPAKRTRSP